MDDEEPEQPPTVMNLNFMDDPDSVNDAQPICFAALHAPLRGSYFWIRWSWALGGVLLLGYGISFGTGV